MQSGEDSLWESFPQILESQEGARRYINAFRAPFQELPSLSLQQTNTLWVCSLLVIPPPIGRTVPQGGFPSDLTEHNLLRCADLVQDVAAGLRVLPPRLCLDLGTLAIALLQLLEAATGVGFCHHCCHPRPHCTCMRASQSAPSTSWSQVVQQTQGYGVTSASGGATDLSTPMGGMPGYMVPPPDFSIWSIPPPEVPPPPGLPTSQLHRPPMGRASLLRAVVNQQAQMLWTPGSQAQALRATTPQAPMPSAPKWQAPLPQAPQMAPPLCQPLPSSGSQPATPYQQAVQPPVKPKGRGVTFDTSADKVAAVGGLDANSHGRQRTRNRDNKTRPASPGRGACKRSSVRTTGEQMPLQVGEHPSGAAHDAPRDSTPGSTSHQQYQGSEGPPKVSVPISEPGV